MAVASFRDFETGSFTSSEIRAQLELNGATAKAFYELLFAEKDKIESEIGYSLSWYNPPDTKSCLAYTRRIVDLKAEHDWPNQHQWLWERLEEFHRVFSSRVKQLKLPEKD